MSSERASSKDPYSILGVASSASEHEIKSTYRKLAKELHPDLNPGNKQAEQKFKEVSVAYDLLSDNKKRALYDRKELSEGPFANASPFAGMGADGAGAGTGPRGARHFYYETQNPGGEGSYSGEFSFEDLFGGAFARAGKQAGPRAGPRTGNDEHYKMEINLGDAVHGAEREITLPSGKRLRGKIPPGVTDGTQLRFSGQGGAGARGGPPGDVYVELSVRQSEIFRRHGNDLEMDLPITLAEAVAGGDVRVPTLDGQVLLKVPTGVSTGSRLRVRGKGLPERGKPQARGDLFVNLRVSMPPHIDDELRNAILEWSRKHPYDPRADLSRAA